MVYRTDALKSAYFSACIAQLTPSPGACLCGRNTAIYGKQLLGIDQGQQPKHQNSSQLSPGIPPPPTSPFQQVIYPELHARDDLPRLICSSLGHVTVPWSMDYWATHTTSAAFLWKELVHLQFLPHIVNWNIHMVGIVLFSLKAELGSYCETLGKKD